MKMPVMLLFTNDTELEDLVARALSEIGGISHLTRDAGDAFKIICDLDNLDIVIVDFEHGPRARALLRAISVLRENMPVIGITRHDEEHVEALEYANGATACLSKQAAATQLGNKIRQLCDSKPKHIFVQRC
jgi:DNA-binding NtrC family response regulator